MSEGLLVHVYSLQMLSQRESTHHPFPFCHPCGQPRRSGGGWEGILESGRSLLFLFWPDIRGLKVTRTQQRQLTMMSCLVLKVLI